MSWLHKFVFIASTTTCTFENDQCGYVNNVTDGYHWQRHAGGTASAGTGPSVDHTLKTLQGHYIFMESSSPMLPNQTSHIISPTFPATSNSPQCLKFYYHMYGQNVGALNVYMMKSGSQKEGNAIWGRNFNQGNTWHAGQITLYPTGPFQV